MLFEKRKLLRGYKNQTGAVAPAGGISSEKSV
jgi:hypothetical protein